MLLARLENRPEIEKAMVSTFRRMLQRYRDAAAEGGGPRGPDPILAT
jgi:hypothetical protein